MLAAMFLVASLSTTPAQHLASNPPAIVLTDHQRHVLHIKHLEHLAYLRELRQAAESRRRHNASGGAGTPAVQLTTTLSGHLGCGGLESLWVAAGGSRAEAFMAAEIAMAESGGYQYATGPYDERGYWQINPDHGALSTYDPYGNARAAIIISDNGGSWYPWTTYTSGAYVGRCLAFA